MPRRTRTIKTRRKARTARVKATAPTEPTRGDDRLLKVKEAAVVLGVCERTLRKWIVERSVPYIRLPGGDLIRFHRSSLERFIARHEQRAL